MLFPIFIYYLLLVYTSFDYNILYYYAFLKKNIILLMLVTITGTDRLTLRLFENITLFYPERKCTEASNTDPCVSSAELLTF